VHRDGDPWYTAAFNFEMNPKKYQNFVLWACHLLSFALGRGTLLSTKTASVLIVVSAIFSLGAEIKEKLLQAGRSLLQSLYHLQCS